MKQRVADLFAQQLMAWPALRFSYEALADVQTRSLDLDGVPYRLQYNPARAASTGARTDAASIAERRCFLCAAHRPPEQGWLPFAGGYEILVNPFPIFPRHLTVATASHTPQRIAGRFSDLLALADTLPDGLVFYNGPQCGASAPDHAHFQAGTRGLLPVENPSHWLQGEVARVGSAVLHRLDPGLRRAWLLESEGAVDDMATLFQAVLAALPLPANGEEPMLNLLAWRDEQRLRVAIFPRARHRPACYPGVLCSPAAVDLAGVVVLPQQQDFESMDVAGLRRIIDEVCLSPADYDDAHGRIAQALRAPTGRVA